MSYVTRSPENIYVRHRLYMCTEAICVRRSVNLHAPRTDTSMCATIYVTRSLENIYVRHRLSMCAEAIYARRSLNLYAPRTDISMCATIYVTRSLETIYVHHETTHACSLVGTHAHLGGAVCACMMLYVCAPRAEVCSEAEVTPL